MPKVSVILTSFNHAQFLREAIDSILNQTYADYELIIWDDASDDDSWEIINSYNDYRIRAYRNEETRRGIWGINKSISEISEGEYIAIGHSDDVWELEKLEKQVTYLDAHPDVGAVFTHVQPIDEKNRVFNDQNHHFSSVFDQPNRNRHEWLRHFFLDGNGLCHPSVLIRKQCYQDCGIYRYGLAQLADFDMWVRLCLKYDIYVIQERLTRFRVLDNDANTSGNRPEVRVRCQYEYYRLLSNYLKIRSAEELCKIFPEAQKYITDEGLYPDYILAMVALELRPYNFAILFAIETLFSLLSRPETAVGLLKSYGFDYRKFISLTGEHDPFRFLHIEEQTQSLKDRDNRIVDLDRLLSERDTQVKTLNLSLSERDERIAELCQTMTDRENQIAGFKLDLDAQEDRIAQLDKTVADRDAKISSLETSLAAVYASTSWRITAGVRFAGKFVRALVGMLPTWRALRRRRHNVALTAIQDLKKSDEPGAWLASGEDPIFAVEGVERLSMGWMCIRASIRSEEFTPLSSSIYLDSGDGFSEDQRLLLPSPENGSTDIVVFLQNNVSAIRFDPMDRPGKFHLERLTFREIGKAEAAVRLIASSLRSRVKHWRDIPTLYRKASDIYRRGGLPLIKDYLVNPHERRGSVEYGQWISRYNQLTNQDRALMRRRSSESSIRPKFSVIMPVYNTELTWLRAAIESVRAQLYPEWELCISDNASTLSGVREELQRYADLDERIHVCFREYNGHISANSNSALGLASGDYVALLDSDDVLPEDALYWVAEEINAHPEADLIFSDEDKLDDEGRRFAPYFKPDWNPALILSQNFFCHLGVYRRDLVDKVGGFREGLEGSQDHDLVLRCADAIDASRIRHIPRILYHWRAITGSTASEVAEEAKPYAWNAGARAIMDHLERKGIKGQVTRTCRFHFQVDYDSPKDRPRVSILMPSACRLELLRPCLSALLERTTYDNYEVLIAVNEIRYQNAEQAAYLRELEGIDKVRLQIYKNRDFNFSWINNWLASKANGSIFCLMNDDIEVITPDWLEKFVARLQLDDVGAVGAMLYFPTDRIQHAGVTLGIGGVAGHTFINQPRGAPGYFYRAALEQDLSCVTAACMAVRRKAFDELGGFNEDLAVAFNDVDFCIRLREKGWRIIWTPQVEHYHHESASLGRHDSPERAELFRREVAMMRKLWGRTLDNDPFYNPNLSLDDPNMVLAFPPRLPELSALMLKNKLEKSKKTYLHEEAV